MNIQALLNRAFAARGRGWRYVLGAKPNPAAAPTDANPCDCTGYLWWISGRKQTAKLNTDEFGPRIPGPRPGAAVWHDPRPPAKFGHAGLVVKVWPDGNFDTLDCSSTDPTARGGAIRYLTRSADKWSKPGSPAVFRMPKTANLQRAAIGAGALAAAAGAAWLAWRWARGRKPA